MKRDVPCNSDHLDCFAIKNGYCSCLDNTRFEDRDCPFFKTKAQNEKEQQLSRDRLFAIGKQALIEHYGGKLGKRTAKA